MTLRVLIVSDRPEYRQLLAHHVTLEWGDALPAEYEPATRGRLRAAFTGSAYDVVLLDHDVEEERGLEWLVNLRLRPGFPPIVYFGPTEHAELELRASAAGALRVLPRTDFEHEQLAEALREIVGRQHNVLAEASRAARAPTPPDRFGSVRVRGYHCVRRIAVGGSSSVYLAELPKTGERRCKPKNDYQGKQCKDQKQLVVRASKSFAVRHITVCRVYGPHR